MREEAYTTMTEFEISAGRAAEQPHIAALGQAGLLNLDSGQLVRVARLVRAAQQVAVCVVDAPPGRKCARGGVRATSTAPFETRSCGMIHSSRNAVAQSGMGPPSRRVA